jgi:hypothetical protein
MIRSAFTLLAIASLAACTTNDAIYDSGSGPATNGPPGSVSQRAPAGGRIVTAPPVVVVPQQAVVAFRPGTGLVDSVQQVNMGTASASAGSSSIPVYRLVVRMDDGTVQTIDQDNRAFRAGDRIRITTDGHVVVL